MNKCIHVWGFLFFLTTILLGSAVFAQDTSTSKSDTTPSTKSKSYSERYKEFYDPKNYSKNYKELHQGGNYVNHYIDMHRENADQFRNATRIRNQTDAHANDIAEDARRLNPDAADTFKWNKYGQKIEPVDGYVGPNAFQNAFAYRDYQYQKRGYERRSIDGKLNGSYGTGEGLWLPNPVEAVQEGQWQDNPLTNILYSKGARSNGLPQTEKIDLPEPMPTPETQQPPLPLGSNPFLPYLQQAASLATPPASTQVHTEGELPNSDTPENQLPSAVTTSEKPAQIPDSATPSIESPMAMENPVDDTLELPIQQTTSQEVPENQPDIQQPPVPSQPVLQSPLQILYNQGVQSFVQRNYPKAQLVFEKLVKTNPASPYFQFGHGLSLFYVGDYTPSLDAFRESYQLSIQKRMVSPNLWQMHTLPVDFRFHMKILAQYVEKNPTEKTARELLFYLSRISSTPPTTTR